MAKSLKILADQLRKNNGGIRLTPLFDDGIVPGSAVEVESWNITDRVGHVRELLGKDGIPTIEGPIACLLEDFKRAHDLNLSSAVELLQPSATAKAEFSRAKEAIAHFDSPVIYGMSLTELEDAIEAADEAAWKKALGQRLQLKKARVVYQVIRGRLSFFFRGQGSVGIDLQGSKLGDLQKAGLSAGWKWRNESTLESKRELVIAVKCARYLMKKQRFERTD